MHTTKKPLIFLAGLILFGLNACDASGGGAAAAPAKGYVTGKAIDTHGKPIAGAKILLDNSVFYASYIHGSTGEDGSYKIKAQPGAWMAHATFKKSYNGKTYTLDLEPDQVDFFDDDGAVRNFVWKLEGRSPRNQYSYYGGFILMNREIGFHEDLENIEITLTPNGPLIDGSQGKTLRLRFEDHYWVQQGHIEDVPIGRYTVTAVLNNDEGTRPLRFRNRRGKENPQQAFTLEFSPESGSGTKNLADILIGD